MTGPLPAPGRTSVRITGDYFQWLHAWSGCLTALLESTRQTPHPIISVGVEVDHAGNLDDVVLTRTAPPHRWMQVKYAVDATRPVNTDWLTKPSSTGGPSLLAKVATTWKALTASGEPADLAIVTNRAADPTDVLVTGRDARTGLLLPAAAQQTANSARGRARQQWATAADLSVPELVDLLAVLRFDVGHDLGLMERQVSLQMQLCGLRGDSTACQAGADWIAAQVRAGQRTLTLADIDAGVATLGLREEQPWTAISIATLKPDPLAADSVHALDWVDRFDGAGPFEKRQPRGPATWRQLQSDIEAIPFYVSGRPRIAITGSLRQATAFTVGAALRGVSGFEVGVEQRGQLWASTAGYATPIAPREHTRTLGAGGDLAVAIGVAVDIADDVVQFVRATGRPVGELLVMAPANGVSDRAISGPGAANAFAIGIRNSVRRACHGHNRVHLFLAGPMGLALLLGHRWNRVAPTIVHEDLGAAAGYCAAFTVAA